MHVVCPFTDHKKAKWREHCTFICGTNAGTSNVDIGMDRVRRFLNNKCHREGEFHWSEEVHEKFVAPSKGTTPPARYRLGDSAKSLRQPPCAKFLTNNP